MARLRGHVWVASGLVLALAQVAHGQVKLGAPLDTPPPAVAPPEAAVLPPPTAAPVLVWPPPEYKLPPVGEVVERPAERDPLLAYPYLAPPGWFANVELGVVAPHMKNRMLGPVPIAGGVNTIHVPGASLNWAAMPRFEFGYRLPRGFGEFLATYQFLNTSGQGDLSSPLGVAHLRSRLTENLLNLDYGNVRVLPATGFLGDGWLIGGRAGVQVFGAFYDARSDQLGLGGTLTGQRVTNNLVGAGPHAELNIWRRLPLAGLMVGGDVEWASIYGHQDQSYSETIATPGAAPVGGTTRLPISQGVGELGIRIMFRWIPPNNNRIHLLLGYQFMEWWQLGRNQITGSEGDLMQHGIFFRGEFTF
jgi:hypothetical protein